MSIYKEIKNAGIDLFVSYHPKVVQLKKESKVLHKELKSKGLSLMQCQELTAKQNGFHNWYNFIHLIKKYYQQDLDSVPFILTTTKKEPTKSDYQTKYNGLLNNSKWLPGDKEDNPILLGYDINFGHYKWQNDSSMITHQLIVGESIHKKYDVYLANQAMKNNRSVVFFNGDGDNDTLKSLVNSAIEKGRQSDLKIINFKNSSIFSDYEYKIQDNFSGSYSMITEIFMSMFELEDVLKAKLISFISATMMYLVYKRESENTQITLAKIRDIISLKNIVKVSQDENIPSYICSNFKHYLNGLSEKSDKVFTEDILVNHEQLREPFDILLKSLIDSNMFNSDKKSISLDSLVKKNNSHIFIFQFDSTYKNNSEIFHKLFLNSIKNSITKDLSTPIESKTNQIKIKEKKNVLYIFIRSCHPPKGISVLPAQARALGLSINFSYSSLSKLENLSNQSEVKAIVANTNTKIFSTLEGDYQTVNLLEGYKNEIANESLLDISNDDLSINMNLNRKKNDHVWLVKRGYTSQVSFDSPYDPMPSIASENVKIYMKLED